MAKQPIPEHVSDSPIISQSPTAANAPPLPVKDHPAPANREAVSADAGLKLSDGDGPRAKLDRRFSWEASSEHLNQYGGVDPQQGTMNYEEDPPDAALAGNHEAIAQQAEPSFDVLNSPGTDTSDLHSPPVPPPVEKDPAPLPAPPSGPEADPSAHVPLAASLPAASLTSTTKSLAFRDIMAMKSPDDRLDHLQLSRKALLDNDHGLTQWITLAQADVKTAKVMPKPANLNSSVGAYQAHRPQPSGSGLQPTVNVAPSGPSPLDRKITSQQVQAKGKDLLHSAGVFGGKANVAAKGLFAKGKSKLKNAGGDKVDH